MKCSFEKNPLKISARRSGFGLAGMMAALVVLTFIAAGVIVVINRAVDSFIDTKSRAQAFEIARENMEQIIAAGSAKEMAEFGISETNPDMKWEKVVETFYEPTTKRMWARAFCSADYIDSEGNEQQVKLVYWLSSLSKKQIAQVIDQQKREKEYLEQLAELEGDVDAGLPEDPDTKSSDPPVEPEPEEPQTQYSEHPLDDFFRPMAGAPPQPYQYWDDVPDSQFWEIIMPILFKNR